jgi:hypothetical protein
MANPPSIRLINSIKMNISSASNASNNHTDDGGITGVDSAIDSPPRIRPNHRPKRQLSQLSHDDDGDPDDELYQSYQESTVAHRLVHSPDRVRRRLQALVDGGEEEQSQLLLTQPPDDEMLPPNVFPSRQTNDDYFIPDDELEIVLKHNAGIEHPHPFQIRSIHHGRCPR